MYRPILTLRSFSPVNSSTPIACLIVGALCHTQAIPAATPSETIALLREELSFSAYDASHWQTPVQLYNGSIYCLHRTWSGSEQGHVCLLRRRREDLKASGETIRALPITPESGDIVTQAARGIYWTRTYVGCGPAGQPIVSFRDIETTIDYFSTWTGSAWSLPAKLPAGLRPNFITDPKGVVTAIEDGAFSRSFDGGATWLKHSLGIASRVESTAIDYAHHRATGQFVFQTMIDSHVKVFTLQFAPPAASSVAEPRDRQ